MRAVFFSDVHLNRDAEKRSELLLSFIERICSDADVVVILGDLFEFYHGYDGYIFPWYAPVADALRNLSDSGAKVYFLEGNHEFGMGRYFEARAGLVSSRSLALELDNRRVFVSHGDEVDNLFLASILRSRLSYATMDLLGPSLTWKVAGWIGFFLSRKTKGYNPKVVRIFRDYARKWLDAGYDAVILAHSHIADRLDIAAKDMEPAKVYLNTGDFVQEHSYVEYTTDMGFRLLTYEPSQK